MQLPQQLLVGPAQPLLLLRLLLHVLLEVGILLRQLSARGQEEASESGGLSSRRWATGHGRRRPPLRGVRDKAGRRHTRPRPNRDRRLSPGPPAHTECTLIPLPGRGGAGRPVHTAKARGRGRKWRGSWCGGPRGARRQWRVPPRHTRCYLASPSWAVPSPATDAGLSSAHLLAREPERTGTRGGRFAPAAPSLAPGSGLVDGVTARWPTEPHTCPPPCCRREGGVSTSFLGSGGTSEQGSETESEPPRSSCLWLHGFSPARSSPAVLPFLPPRAGPG